MESFTRLFRSVSLDDNPPVPSILNSKQFFQFISRLFRQLYSTMTLYTSFLQSYLQSQSKDEQMHKRITQLLSQRFSLKTTLQGNPFSIIEHILIKQWITKDEKVSKNRFLQDIVLLWISCMDSTPMAVDQFINQYQKQALFIGQINQILYGNALSADQLQIVVQETPHLIITYSFHWETLCKKYLPQVEGRIGRNQRNHDKMHSSQNYAKSKDGGVNIKDNSVQKVREKAIEQAIEQSENSMYKIIDSLPNDSGNEFPFQFLKKIEEVELVSSMQSPLSFRHTLSMQVKLATKTIKNLPFFLNVSDKQNGLPLTTKVMRRLNKTNQLCEQIQLLNRVMPALQQDLKEYSSEPLFRQLSKEEKNACLAYCIEKGELGNVERNIQLSMALVKPKQFNRCSLLFNREVEMLAISILEGVHMISSCSFP